MTKLRWVDGPTDADTLSQLVAAHVESMEAICALCAVLTLRVRKLRAAPAVERALSEVLDVLGLAELGTPSVRCDSGALQTVLLGRIVEAYELSVDPGSRPGGNPTSREVMEGQTLSSEALGAVVYNKVVPLLPGLEARLSSPGASFLDVGIGAGGLAISFCSRWSKLVAVGIDVSEPALVLARERIAKAGFEQRIALRRQDVSELEDCDAYDLTWVPANFIGDDVLEEAVDRARVAARPGGWIIVSLLRGGGALSDALTRLRVGRAGGSALSAVEAESLLKSRGWEAVQTLTREVPRSVFLVAGRRPGRF